MHCHRDWSALSRESRSARSACLYQGTFRVSDGHAGWARGDPFRAGIPLPVPLYNLVPDVGQPAAFGFSLFGVAIRIVVHPRAEKGYGLVATAEVPQAIPVYGAETTFWGVPGAHSHDLQRFVPEGFEPGSPFPEYPPGSGEKEYPAGSGEFPPNNPLPSGAPTVPSTSNPSVCGEPLTTTIRVDSWQHPGRWLSYASTILGGSTGCGALSFDPSLSTVGGSQAGSPSGLSVDLHVPQDESPNGLFTPDVKNTTVTLPADLQINPAAADGLAGLLRVPGRLRTL